MPVYMNESVHRILSLSLSEVKSRCKLHLNVILTLKQLGRWVVVDKNPGRE